MGKGIQTLSEACRACDVLHELGRPNLKHVFVTSLDLPGMEDQVSMLLSSLTTSVTTSSAGSSSSSSSSTRKWLLSLPKIGADTQYKGGFTGSGDLTAALLLAHSQDCFDQNVDLTGALEK